MKNTCPDCGIKISSSSKNCRKCWNKKRPPRPDLVERNKSKKQRDAVKESHVGGKRKEVYKKISISVSKSLIGLTDEKARRWKGEDVSYSGLHYWVYRKLGAPKECKKCGLSDPKRKYQWANVSREYKRELSDWVRMCCSCHKLYDLNKITL